MNATAPSPAGASPALAAFLRGSGRRALLLAELQCGDPVRGDAAAAAFLPDFVAAALDVPMAQWPRRFWSGLLAMPALRGSAAAHWNPGFGALAGTGPGARAALLLWLVAGLGEEEAATALGVAIPAWRLALQRAAPRGADGELDATAWRRLEDAVRESLRSITAERLDAWERACLRALPDTPRFVAATPAARDLAPRPGRRPRWLLPALVLCLAALAATFLLPWPGRDGAGAGDNGAGIDGPVARKPLPAAGDPAAFEPGDETALLLHPDFDLLAAGGATPLLQDLAFDAWYAAQRGDAAVSTGDAADAPP